MIEKKWYDLPRYDYCSDDERLLDFFPELLEEDEIVFGRDPLRQKELPWGMTEIVRHPFNRILRPK